MELGILVSLYLDHEHVGVGMCFWVQGNVVKERLTIGVDNG
jgi:hypothetical protein